MNNQIMIALINVDSLLGGYSYGRKEEAMNYVKITDADLDYELPVDRNYLPGEYNIPLFDASVRQFRLHRNAWKRFSGTTHSFCFVLENGTDVKDVNEVFVKLLLQIEDDCDVFFPFDKSQRNNCAYEQPSVLGYLWGAHAYFLSRNGVEKLLTIPVIRQEVDEEILQLSMEEKLNVYMNDTGLVEDTNSYGRDICLKKQEVVREKIFSANVWPKGLLDKAKQLLCKVCNIAHETGINLTLDSGSLLGHIRHGSIMPWDDDLDLAIADTDVKRLIEKLSEFPDLLVYYDQNGMNNIVLKVCFVNGEPIEGHSHRFPFLDIWIYVIEEDKIIFLEGRIFPFTDFYPLLNTVFEGSLCKMPHKVFNCLDIQYPDWRNRISIYRWCHRTEKADFIPLQTNIKVDGNGRIILP